MDLPKCQGTHLTWDCLQHLQCLSYRHLCQHLLTIRSDQIRSAAQSCPILCNPMNRSTPGLPVHHQVPEFTQTHVGRLYFAGTGKLWTSDSDLGLTSPKVYIHFFSITSFSRNHEEGKSWFIKSRQALWHLDDTWGENIWNRLHENSTVVLRNNIWKGRGIGGLSKPTSSINCIITVPFVQMHANWMWCI